MIKSNPNKSGNHKGLPRRKLIRLKGYDYSQAGLYFVTICCQNRAHLFGNIKNGKMILNDAGKMIETEWMKLLQRFSNIQLHQYITMPNHFHAILEITVRATLVVVPNTTTNIQINNNIAQNEKGQPRPNEKGQPQGIAPTKAQTGNPNKKTIGDILGGFKSITTVEYIRGVKNYNWQRFNGKLWQRNYWEHIIRNEKLLHLKPKN
jgi:REP element-mobilizing transposase RayT